MQDLAVLVEDGDDDPELGKTKIVDTRPGPVSVEPIDPMGKIIKGVMDKTISGLDVDIIPETKKDDTPKDEPKADDSK